MRGGAARKKKEAAEAAHHEAMVQEYASWHAISDQTENTGVMRLVRREEASQILDTET